MGRYVRTKQVLQDTLQQLYAEAAKQRPAIGENYLLGGDGAFLGRITENPHDQDSISNQYGTYGSPYSPTSIQNPYSLYASPYSPLSMNNIYASNPPILVLRSLERGRVTKNPSFQNRIDPRVFLSLLRSDVAAILQERIPVGPAALGEGIGRAYLLAADGAFLGTLNPNEFDQNSIFNEYGPYGSKFSPNSIFNQFGVYGSQFSQLSPYNPYTSTPPTLYVSGQRVAHVSANQFLSGDVIHPDHLKQWARSNLTAWR